jgi:hypothetical protein
MSKKIDWTKPVQVVAHEGDTHPVRVIAAFAGKAFITWGSETTAHAADSYGNISSLPRSHKAENVPEELYLRLYRRETDGSWNLDSAGRVTEGPWKEYDRKQALPRAMWEYR